MLSRFWSVIIAIMILFAHFLVLGLGIALHVFSAVSCFTVAKLTFYQPESVAESIAMSAMFGGSIVAGICILISLSGHLKASKFNVINSIFATAALLMSSLLVNWIPYPLSGLLDNLDPLNRSVDSKSGRQFLLLGQSVAIVSSLAVMLLCTLELVLISYFESLEAESDENQCEPTLRYTSRTEYESKV